jgi:hypothetical protein
MQETNDFFNKGFGWVCRHCDVELSRKASVGTHSRLISEGEAEAKIPQLSTLALAKWADPERRTLMCPRCGITERIDIA